MKILICFHNSETEKYSRHEVEAVGNCHRRARKGRPGLVTQNVVEQLRQGYVDPQAHEAEVSFSSRVITFGLDVVACVAARVLTSL